MDGQNLFDRLGFNNQALIDEKGDYSDGDRERGDGWPQGTKEQEKRRAAFGLISFALFRSFRLNPRHERSTIPDHRHRS